MNGIVNRKKFLTIIFLEIKEIPFPMSRILCLEKRKKERIVFNPKQATARNQ